MTKHNIESFMSSVGSGGRSNFSRWKDKGSTIGWIHPNLGIHERIIHGVIPVQQENQDGDMEYRNRRFICLGEHCPVCELSNFASKCVDKGDVDEDEIVLKGNKDTRKLSFKDLAGEGGWKTDPVAKKEYMFGWIPRDDRDDESPVEIITATEGLGVAIKRVISSEIEDRGEKRGNPLLSPYAMKLLYHKDEAPMRKYDARRIGGDIAEIDDEVKDIMDSDGDDLEINLDSHCEPMSEKDLMSFIETCWVNRGVSFEEFEEFYGPVDDEDEKPKKSGRKKNGRKKNGRNKVKDDEDDEDDEDEKPKKKSGRKRAGKSKKAKVECDCCENVVVPTKYGKCPECGEELDVP